jgi:hypothetical protein
MRALLCAAVVLGLAGVAEAQSGWRVTLTGLGTQPMNFNVLRAGTRPYGQIDQWDDDIGRPATPTILATGRSTIFVSVSPTASFIFVRRENSAGYYVADNLMVTPASNSFSGPLNMKGTACTVSVSPIP